MSPPANMRQVDGLMLARNLRADANPPRVIMMSGRFDPRIRPEVLEAGVSALLTKPFTLEALRAVAAPVPIR